MSAELGRLKHVRRATQCEQAIYQKCTTFANEIASSLIIMWLKLLGPAKWHWAPIHRAAMSRHPGHCLDGGIRRQRLTSMARDLRSPNAARFSHGPAARNK